MQGILRGLNLLDTVCVLSARDLDSFGARSMRTLADAWWNLADLEASYRSFVSRFEPMLQAFNAKSTPAPEEAFVVRTLLIHCFRRVILHDPQLPAAADWPGHDAYTLCRSLYRTTQELSELYLMRVLEDQTKSPREASFTLRHASPARPRAMRPAS